MNRIVLICFFFFFNDTATTEIYTLSLHDALPILPYTLLSSVADLPEPELRGGLARLQAGEFLHQVRLFPDLEYTFKHAFTHEVAYHSLLHQRRRGLHARIVGAIETLFAGRLDEQIDHLAH